MAVVELLDRLTPGSRVLVENQVFDRDVVLGPAMVAILDGCVFQDSQLHHPFEAQFLEVEEGRYLAGVVGLRNVTFRRCLLRYITFVGTPDHKRMLADKFQA